ncbi:Mitochondrial zinc maintenance protein 1, mitochondrial [Lignoscripta atroalba]|nr:Mitochondrial zinc maintenance protein 1, mitochondrial [Lignoscripta atroalba]
MALAAYRHILRSTRIAFQGDQRVLHAARHQARQLFASNSSLSTASPEALAQIAHAEDVAKVLRQNIVQGQRIAADGEGEKYQLRIHDDTERGDNATIKMAGKNMGGVGQARCGPQ